ncbi:universal stress protein [Exilibacterium tricleocarpae]|uniref:Universal stress protein n=1 Tax=Exilibacterium tricleocarpae TaxID=2591008 RepID=A0A545T8I8_9GAMM|nr:universal stress protein [Exilibacterium tricleocarpae]TQV73519.1 universal stress protein [Exilibacterium tricleocarpae]
MIRTILFATDLGVFTSYVLQHVVALAGSCKARVIVVHVVEPLGSFANAMVKSYLPQASGEALTTAGVEEMLASIRARVKVVLAQEYMDSQDDISFIDDIQVLQGQPAQVILEEAGRRQVDLIVMGSHSGKAMDDHTLGSVANKVLLRAKVPVYVVPMVRRADLSSST